MRAIVYLDIESDGLDPYTRKAWEFGAYRRSPSGATEEVQFFIGLGDLRNSDPKALEMSRFYDRHPEGRAVTGRNSSATAVPALQAAQAIVAFTHGATIVGAQPHFDTVTLERLIRGQGLLPTWHYRLRDVESMTAGYLHRDVGGLAACAEALDLEFPEEKRHTALGDAQMALAIYDKVIGRWHSDGDQTA